MAFETLRVRLVECYGSLKIQPNLCRFSVFLDVNMGFFCAVMAYKVESVRLRDTFDSRHNATSFGKNMKNQEVAKNANET
jgi:hypothetical protein